MADIFLERIATFAEESVGNSERKHGQLSPTICPRVAKNSARRAAMEILATKAMDGDVVGATTPVT
jgi:hypothetical protein